MSTGKDYERLSDDAGKGDSGDVETTPTDDQTTPSSEQPTSQNDQDTPPESSSACDTRVITKQELKEHRNTEGEIWIAIDGIVYDVYKFASRHPGGEEVLEGEKGTNATEAFHLIGHSKQAVKMMAKFKIGVLEGTKTKVDNEKDDKFRTPKSKNCTLL